jgi:nitric oxide reductase large subunit
MKKQKKYWLRGALWTLILEMVFLIWYFIFYDMTGTTVQDQISDAAGLLVILPIAGAVLGLVYGKICSKGKRKGKR